MLDLGQANSSENWYAMLFLLVLAKPDPSIGQGSCRKPMLRFLPAPEMLQSNQIAEHTETNMFVAVSMHTGTIVRPGSS